MKYTLDAEIRNSEKNYITNGLHYEFRTKKEALKILQKIGYPKRRLK